MNQKLDCQLEASYLISKEQISPAKQLQGDFSARERENNFQTTVNTKTIKKEQIPPNYHSHSPFKETIITMPSFIHPEIKNQIIQNEKQIFIQNTMINERIENFQSFDKNQMVFNSNKYENNLNNSEKKEALKKNIDKNDEIIRKINTINQILDIDLKEKIDKFYELAMKAQDKKKTMSETKAMKQEKTKEKTIDKSPPIMINVIKAPTMPIEDFLDETEILIKQMKIEAHNELDSLYNMIVKKVK